MARTVHIHPKAPPKPAVGSPCRSHGERAGKTKHTMNATSALLQQLDTLSAPELRRLLAEHLTRQKLGLYWERDAIAHDQALNADVVLPRVVPQYGHAPEGCTTHCNLIIEGDNFDSLRLLRSTHAGKVRVIYIDPPYNTGNKDWVYNDKFVGANDRWRHSQWLEFLYQRLLLARDLLTSDGVILVSINDENRARLELLMDEVFPGRRLGSLVWRTKDTGNDLVQRFSHVHEHVLVYANPGFAFNGRPTDRSKFRNPDKDLRGEWSPQPLTKAHSYLDRENTYYPIQDPDTGYWYPCDPNRVGLCLGVRHPPPVQRRRSRRSGSTGWPAQRHHGGTDRQKADLLSALQARGTTVLRHQGRTAGGPQGRQGADAAQEENAAAARRSARPRFLGGQTHCAGPPFAQGALDGPARNRTPGPVEQLDWRHERGRW